MLDFNTLETIVFSILTLFMVGGSLVMITSKQTIFSAFGFLLAMIALGGMFALLNNRFLSIAQIMVSVGAIVILSMLTILTVNAKEENMPEEKNKFILISISAIIVSPFTFLLYKALTTLPEHFTKMQTINSKVIGSLLFSEWVLPFEILSILLMSAMLGAIIIAKDKLKGENS